MKTDSELPSDLDVTKILQMPPAQKRAALALWQNLQSAQKKAEARRRRRPNLITVQGSTKPTLPVDTSAYPSTTYPNWNLAPWAFGLNVDGVLWGMWQWQIDATNFTKGNNGPVEDD